MLKELKVVSLGIIDELIWKPYDGLNVITGETGAGKSLIIDAIEALLSARLSEDSIRFGDGSTRIEALFSLTQSNSLNAVNALLEKEEIEFGDIELVLSCEFRRHGRTIPRINGVLVTRALISQVCALLLDVHAQSQHLSLFNPRNHMEYLDAYASVGNVRGEFTQKARLIRSLGDKLDKLRLSKADSAKRAELLRYQSDEILNAKLKENEKTELEQQRAVMLSSEKLKEKTAEAERAIRGESASSALSYIRQAIKSRNTASGLDPTLQGLLDSLTDASYNLEEVARELRSYVDRLTYNPRRLEEVDNRLHLLHTLERKHGVSSSELIGRQKEIEQELRSLDTVDEEIGLLEKEIESLKRGLGTLASDLSTNRKNSAEKLEKDVERELAQLELADVRFQVRLQQKECPDGIVVNGRSVEFDDDGVDSVQFLVATNKGEPFKPLAEIASTGELSRFTLAVKIALAEADTIPVLVFDEIDIGVGGRSGDVIGKKMWELSRHHQTICVTHLPQIAVYADTHFAVRKAFSDSRITSDIVGLDTNSRLAEIVMMLGGIETSASVEKSALELLERAEEWKTKS